MKERGIIKASKKGTVRTTIDEIGDKPFIKPGDVKKMGLLYLLEGHAKVCFQTYEGREINLLDMRPGDITVITNSGKHLIALMDIKTFKIDEKTMKAIMKENDKFTNFINETMADRYSIYIATLQKMMVESCEKRIASFLLGAMENLGRNEIRISQENLAREVNSVREVVARKLNKFVKAGYIKKTRCSIIVLDKEALEEIKNNF